AKLSRRTFCCFSVSSGARNAAADDAIAMRASSTPAVSGHLHASIALYARITLRPSPAPTARRPAQLPMSFAGTASMPVGADGPTGGAETVRFVDLMIY